MRRYWLIIPFALLLSGVGPAYTKDKPEWRSWPMGQRVGIDVGAFFANLETNVQLNSASGLLGAGISFEQDLGLSDTVSRPMAAGYWRFFKKHRLNFSYFKLDRSGQGSSTVNIRFGEFEFEQNLPIQAFFDVEIINLGYSYSILFDEKKELSLGLALSFQDLAIGLQGTVAGQPLGVSESESVLAPLPTFTGKFSYAFTPKWILDTTVGYFTIELDSGGDELAGDVLSLNAGIRWQVLKHFHLGLLYQYFSVDVKTKNEARQFNIDYKYDGPVFFLGTSF